jgi:hypothetical protein
VIKQNYGKIDAELAKTFLADTYDENLGRNQAGGGTLCGVGFYSGAINTKTIDSSLAKSMAFWARMGVSDGRAISFASDRQAGRVPEFLRDIPSQPWIRSDQRG